MTDVANFYYELGKQDASKFKRHIKATIEAETSCFYRLGVLNGRYQECPTRLALVTELCREFSFYDELPNLAVISLKNNYSHRLLKQVMDNLGYHVPAKPNLDKGFNAWRFF